MDFSASRFLSGSSADRYVEEIDLPGKASVGLGPGYIDRMVSSRAAMLRPQFAKLRDGAVFATEQRLGEGTITGQTTKARDTATAQIGGEMANIITQAEAENERIRAQAESAYLGHLSFRDNLELQANIAEEEMQRARDDAEFGFSDAVSVASLFV